ncbi:MAG: TOBE domain-containing protein [Gloeomargaritaceae cyanobacterium C42_A2020_066]|nr:TOBE domain-containing protein [Gloeomargaritaceae cyanobacterium C42_A2020_066]
MQVLTRNALKGTVKHISLGRVNAEVTLEIVPGVEITAVITRITAERLGLEEGKSAYAIVKPSEVEITLG